MPRLSNSLPKYCKHRGTGQAVVTIAGRDIYLGKYGSRASRAEYDRLMGEYIAAGRTLPVQYGDGGITLVELISRFHEHAKVYYLKDGKPTSEVDEYRRSLRVARQSHGRELARDFTPSRLKAVRAVYCNKCFSEQNGDFLAAIAWRCECTIGEAVHLVADHLGATVETTSRSSSARPRASKPTKTYATAGEAIGALQRKMGRPSAQWLYHDADGEHVGTVLRWDSADGGKEIRPLSRMRSRKSGLFEPKYVAPRNWLRTRRSQKGDRRLRSWKSSAYPVERNS